MKTQNFFQLFKTMRSLTRANWGALSAIIFVLYLAGCASLKEDCKIVWGSSTRTLEKAQSQGIEKSFVCSFDQCFDAIVLISMKETDEIVNEVQVKGMSQSKSKVPEPFATRHDSAPLNTTKIVKLKNFEIFIQDRNQRHFVVMRIPGCVDTTEVGIFLTPLADGKTKINISSLSTIAKTKVSSVVFEELASLFPQHSEPGAGQL